MRWIVPLLLTLAPAAAVQAESADRMSYVLLTGSDGSAMMNGSMDDITRARALQSGGAPLLYVHQDGATYLIRDAATLRRAQEIMRPQQELGTRQGELGRRQGALGAEQGRLGRLMADARVRELGELGRQQGELGRQQAALGQQQAALGEKQAALGREQARLAELARPQFRALVADAIQRGVAQRLD